MRNALAYLTLISTSSLMALIFTVPAPLLYRIGQEYGDWIAQGMSSLPALGIIVAGPLTGWLNRRLSTRALLLPALTTYGAVGLLALILRDPYALLASRFVIGFASAVAVAASLTLITARYDGPARLKAFGFQGGIASAAGLVALWLSGTLAGGGDWRASFSLYAFAFVLLLLALISLPRATSRSKIDVPAHATMFATLPSLWPLYLAVVLLFSATFSTGLQLSFKLGDSGIADPLDQRNVILCGSLFNAIGSSLFGYIVATIGSRMAIVGSIALMSAGAVTIGLGSTAVPIGAGAALMGLGAGIAGPYLIGYLVSRVDESERAGALGLFYSCIFAGEFLNPLYMQPLRQVVGADAAFVVLGVLLLAGVLRAATLRPIAAARE